MLSNHDPMDTRHGWDLSDDDVHEYENRELEKLYAEMATEQAILTAKAKTLDHVALILKTFYQAPISISTLRPVLELAEVLNPELKGVPF